MPIYDFMCEDCGPFEQWRDHAAAGEPLACPSCGARARRSYAAPFVRSPAGPFASASREVRARAERSHTGEPVVRESTPGGRPLESALRPHGHGHAHRHPPPRPWLIGH